MEAPCPVKRIDFSWARLFLCTKHNYKKEDEQMENRINMDLVIPMDENEHAAVNGVNTTI